MHGEDTMHSDDKSDESKKSDKSWFRQSPYILQMKCPEASSGCNNCFALVAHRAKAQECDARDDATKRLAGIKPIND